MGIMNVQFFLPLFLLAAIIHTTTAQCGGSLSADVNLRTLTYNGTGNNNKTEETCTWYISPNKTEPAGSYLSLKWNKFDVRGKLPGCSDYIEVFLTRSYKSIGKYCSDNMVASAPFNMYSYDGHAKIVSYVKARNSTSSFSLTYDTYNRANTVFGKRNSTSCYRHDNETDVNNFATGGWPYGYGAGQMCQVRYGSGKKNTNSMIAVMDLEMEKLSGYCSDDYLQVLQSESTGGSAYYITGKLCGSKPYHFTATMNYVWFQYMRKQVSSKRGGIIGYLSYIIDPSQITTTTRQTTTTSNQRWPPKPTNSGNTSRKISSTSVCLALFVILASLTN